MNKISSLIVATVVFFGVLVGSVQAANVWINNTYIRGVQADGDGNVVLYLPLNSDPICSEGGKLFYVILNQNGVVSGGLKNILAVSLVAYSTGKQVSIYYDNSTSNCSVQIVYLSPN